MNYDFFKYIEDNSVLYYGLAIGLFLCLMLFVKRIFRNARFRRQYSSLAKLSGEEFENFLCHLYTQYGYQVKRIGGKGDFGVDLLVTKDGITTAVQAKRYTKNVSLSAVQEVYAGKTYYGADDAVVITTSRFTKAAKQLALPCEVTLIDCDELEKMYSRIQK